MNVTSAASAARYSSAYGQRLGKPEGGAAPRTPKYTFDPFDKKTWDVKAPKGSHVDVHA